MTAATAPELSPQRVSDTLAERPGIPRPRSSVPSPSAGAVAMRHMLTGDECSDECQRTAAARARAEADRGRPVAARPLVRTRVTVTAVERALPAASKARTETVCTP